ncbi:hypothetical protein [Novosphingobium sp. Rr 2-17]|uniref:hypothetical protein n=1 Tax=Novosphingobium sp. Rr 2-17 TaxID=555793 RepID=UPI0005B887FF|nr:hypothetical protein [Novosphingobium sp. Rr 2-17]
MSTISPREFAALRGVLPAITAEHLFAVYRISETTWRKLREGRPVKRVTLDRIRARYRDMGRAAEWNRKVS